MKILLGQINPVVGAVEQNVSRMLEIIRQAKADGVQLVIFPELAVPGYPPKDLLFYPELVGACIQANDRLIAASDASLCIIWGNIRPNQTGVGKPLFNTGYCAYNGAVLALATKSQLPTYDVFDEARYFEPGSAATAVPVFECFGQRMALTVCEDLWSHDCFSLDEKESITPVQYSSRPLDVLDAHPMDYLLNISASPYVVGKPAQRCRLIQRIAQAEQATVVYVNQVGANDDLIFDGHSSVTRPTGQQWVVAGFQEQAPVYNDALSQPQTGFLTQLPTPTDELLEALVLGIRDYVQKTGFQKVFIGLSGGIDSALTAVLAVRALGLENVTGVAMPGPYSSEHSVTDARALAENLGIRFLYLPINPPFQAYVDLLSEGEILQDLAEQNLQARLRGTMLMTLANREDALVLSTGNKSEVATGYSTLYGDSCGALAPLADILKTQVYELSHRLNALSEAPLIPLNTLEKPPSAELAPNQKDSDSLPPYDLLDDLLKRILEDQLGFSDLLDMGYDKKIVSQTLQRVMRNEYKRQQMPPSLKVSRKAFGSGRVFPIVQQLALASGSKAKAPEEISIE